MKIAAYSFGSTARIAVRKAAIIIPTGKNALGVFATDAAPNQKARLPYTIARMGRSFVVRMNCLPKKGNESVMVTFILPICRGVPIGITLVKTVKSKDEETAMIEDVFFQLPRAKRIMETPKGKITQRTGAFIA